LVFEGSYPLPAKLSLDLIAKQKPNPLLGREKSIRRLFYPFRRIEVYPRIKAPKGIKKAPYAFEGINPSRLRRDKSSMRLFYPFRRIG